MPGPALSCTGLASTLLGGAAYSNSEIARGLGGGRTSDRRIHAGS